jgi:hypothetical protein
VRKLGHQRAVAHGASLVLPLCSCQDAIYWPDLGASAPWLLTCHHTARSSDDERA